MKFTFDRDSMIKEISIAQEIISSKLPDLPNSYILITAANNTLTIKATDKKVNYETIIPVNIETEGSVAIFCNKFMELLNNLDSGEIEFNVTEDSSSLITATIKPVAKKLTYVMKAKSSYQFPEVVIGNDVPYFEIPSKEFKEMIQNTVFAVSEDETRYFMNGVYLEKEGDILNLVGTDSKRLSICSKSLLGGVSDFPAAIVHPKILNIILKNAPEEGNISLSIIDKMIFFKFGNYKFGAVLIDGSYPNYRSIIPKNQDKSFQVEKNELVKALKHVAPMLDKNGGRIYFNISSGILKISSQYGEVTDSIGTADEEIPCEYDGDNHVIALNYKFINDPLKVITADRIKFEFVDEVRAVTMKAEPDSDYLHIFAPMQIK